MSSSLYELPKNCDFSKIRNASNQEFDCSPKLTNKFFSKFYGMLINAPDEVVWPKSDSVDNYAVGPSGDTDGPMRLMVAGLVRIKYKDMGLKGDASRHVLVVAVNQNSAQAFTGRMPEPECIVAPRPISNAPEPIVSDANQNALLTSHFNFDLVHDLAVPITDAIYTVYAMLGEFTSNVLSVTTRVER